MYVQRFHKMTTQKWRHYLNSQLGNFHAKFMFSLGLSWRPLFTREGRVKIFSRQNKASNTSSLLSFSIDYTTTTTSLTSNRIVPVQTLHHPIERHWSWSRFGKRSSSIKGERRESSITERRDAVTLSKIQSFKEVSPDIYIWNLYELYSISSDCQLTCLKLAA